MASAASGKGMASVGLDLVRDIHKEHEILIPGDSTYPAFFTQLWAQDGIGYMHESEGSVITDIWKSGTMSYNTALRKAAEHEPITRNRMKDGVLEIPCPRLSLLLTGTFGQFHTLVPSVENGFFSRLTTLVVRGKGSYQKQMLLQSLPEEFETGMCIAESKKIGIHERTARRWIEYWTEAGMICKVNHGCYRKVA